MPHVKSWGNSDYFTPLKQVFFSRKGCQFGHFVKNVGRSAHISDDLPTFLTKGFCNGNDLLWASVQMMVKMVISLQKLCPHFWRTAHIFDEVIIPVEKTANFGAKPVWNGPQTNFVALAHILNVILQKTGSRLVDSSLGRAVYKVPPHIGGSHSALCLDTQLSERDRVQ